MSRGWRRRAKYGHVSRDAAGGGKVEGPKSDQAFREEIHFWNMWFFARVAGTACAKYVFGDSDGHVSQDTCWWRQG